MKDESEVQQLIQIAGPQDHCLLMRNNSGALPDKDGRIVRYGLGNISKKHNDEIKSSDLIGITSMVITPDMVNSIVGVFTAVEVKAENWKPGKDKKREEAQAKFINWVQLRGGIGGFASNVEEFQKIVRSGVQAYKRY